MERVKDSLLGDERRSSGDGFRTQEELASDLHWSAKVAGGVREDSYLRQAEVQYTPGAINAKSINGPPLAGAALVSQKSLLVVYFTCFVDLLGFGLLFPVLPGEITDVWGGDAADVGLVMASFSVGQAVGSTWMGYLSDRVGRRPVMNFSLLCSAITLFMMGYVDNVTSCTLIRTLSGLSSATVGTAQAYIADVTTDMDQRARYMRFTQAALSMGIVMGPVIGGFMYQYTSWKIVCFAGAGISLLNFLVGVAYLTESLHLREDKEERGVNWKVLCGKLRADHNLYYLLMAYFLVQIGWSAFESMYIIYAEGDPLGVDSQTVGAIFAGVGVSILVTNIIGAKTNLVTRYGEKTAVLVGSFGRGGALSFITFMPTVATSIVLVMFIGISGALIAPSLVAMVTAFSDEKTHGSLLGITQMMGAISRSFSPYVCGLLFNIDTKSLNVPEHSYPFFFGAAAMILTILVLIPLKLPKRYTNPDGPADLTNVAYDPLLDEDPEFQR